MHVGGSFAFLGGTDIRPNGITSPWTRSFSRPPAQCINEDARVIICRLRTFVLCNAVNAEFEVVECISCTVIDAFFANDV